MSQQEEKPSSSSASPSNEHASEAKAGIKIPANSLMDILKSEYSPVTREAIQKKYQEQATNLPFKARVEAKLQGFYGEDVGPQALNPLKKGIHQSTFKRGWTPLQKKITLLFGSFVLGQVFYFGGRYVWDNFLNSQQGFTHTSEQGGVYYGRDANQFNAEVDRLTNRMMGDYKKFKGSNDVTPEEQAMIERDALNRIAVKYAEQHEILGSATSKAPASKYIPR